MARVLKHPALKEPLVFPKGTSDFEIYSALADKLFPVEELPPPPKEEAGFTGGFGEGISTLGGAPEAARYLISPTAERRRAAAEAGESEYEFQRVKDIEGLGGLGRFVREQAGSALGFIAAPVAASAAAAKFAPVPLKPFAATGAFLTAAGAQYLTDTTARQAAVQEGRVKEGKAPELPDATKIALTSAAQAGLDVAGFRLFRPLGEMIGLAGRESAEKVAKEVAEITAKEGAEAGAKRLLGKKSIAAGAVTGAAFEAAQEVAQQALERFGAGLDLASDDALEEYFESAVGGGLLGGPIGGVSTYAGNVRKGVYSKDFLKQTADAIEGKQVNLGEEWDNYSKQIQIDAPTFDLVDDQGNFLKYTPDLLERLGIDPNAKAINVGGKQRVSIPMKDVLEADTGNETIGTALLTMFRNDRFRLGKEIKNDARKLDPEVLAEKVKEYETLTAALKTYEAFFNPKQAVNSPTNFVVQQSPTDPKKFVVFNPVTGRNAVDRNFSSAENAQKYIDGQLEQEKRGKTGPEVLMAEDLEIQPDPVKSGVFTVFNKKTSKYDTKKEFKTEAEAQDYINTKLGIPAKPTAPTAPTETPEDIAARQAKEARDQLYKDLAARYPNNPDAVAEITQAAEDLETTMSPTDALAQAETTYLQNQEAEAGTAAKTTTPKKEPPAPTVKPPEVGFRTAKGSVYSVDEQGKTSRTKVSEGKGQGTTYEPHPVLYVTPEDSRNILSDMQSGSMNKAAGKKSNSVRLGYVLNNTFKHVTEVSQIPEGADSVVAVIDKNTNQAVGVYPAKLDPEVGLSPIEKLYNPDGTANTHVGNPIVEIFGKPTRAKTASVAPSATPKAGERSEAYMAIKAMKDKIDDLMRQSAEAQEEIMTLQRVQYGSPRYKRKQELLEKRQMLDGEAGGLLFEFDKAKAEYIKNNPEEVARIQAEKTASVAPSTTPAPPPKAPRSRKAPTGQPYEKYTAQMREMLTGVDPESGLAEDLNEFINLAEESKNTTIAKELSQLASAYAQATRDSTNPKLSQTEQDSALQRASNIFETLKDVRDRAAPKNAAEMKAAKDATGNADTGNKVAAKVTKDVCG